MGDELQIRWAGADDLGAIMTVVNVAFRQAESFFVEGERVNFDRLRPMWGKGRFLLAEDGGELAGCVYLELRGARAYFGLLAVEPARQGQGVGRRLIQEAEEQARAAGCRMMDIQIVSVRKELAEFYRRLGYAETGTAPFPAEVATKTPCHFIIMSKRIG
jgi:GNAT superfamily N-acetyltransferase